MLTPELLNKVSIWRQKCLEDTISVEEMKEAILLLRENRRTAESKKPSTKTSTKSTSDLLAELNGL